MPVTSGTLRGEFSTGTSCATFRLARCSCSAVRLLFNFGLAFGAYHWAKVVATNELVPTGTIMIAAITLLIGFQLLLAFLSYDIGTTPREVLHPFLERGRKSPEFPFASKPAAKDDAVSDDQSRRLRKIS